MKYSKEEINKIINLKDGIGRLMDIFNLVGSLLLTEHQEDFAHFRYSTHTLPILYSEFDWCETEEDVKEQFHTSLKEAVNEKLL